MGWFEDNAPKAQAIGGWFERNAPKAKQAAETVVNAQHPLLSNEDRLKITNLEDRPEYVARWLGERGFEVKEKDGELILRKGDDPRWYKVEKTGWLPNEWMDVTGDLGNELAQMAAMAKGAAVGGALSAPSGPGAVIGAMGGAGVGSAAYGAGRAAAAHAAGFRGKEDIGASAVDVGIEGALGAAGEGIGRAIGAGWKAGKGAITKQLAKRASAKAAARAAPLGESAGEVAARTALARKLQPKVPAGVDVDDLLKRYQRGELRREQLDAWLEKSLPEKTLQKLERPAELAPVSQEPVRGPKHWLQKQRAAQNTLADYDAETTRQAQKALDPKGKLPAGFEYALPEKVRWSYPKETLKLEAPEKFLKRLHENNVRELAAAVGIRGAAPAEKMGALSRSLPEIEKDLIRLWPKVEEVLVQKRHLLHQEINKAIKTVGTQRLPEPIEIVARQKSTGALRRYRVQTNAPVESKPYTRDAIREAAESLVEQTSPPGMQDLTHLREWARRVRPKLERPLSNEKLTAIEAADFDDLVEILFQAQKATFKGGIPSYDPKGYGLRWMWDMDVKNWRSVALDHVRSMKRVGGQFLDFSNPAWRKAATAYEGGLRTAGRAMSAVGRGVEYPARKAEQLAEFLGFSLRGPARGVLAGASAGYALTPGPLPGQNLAKLYFGSKVGGQLLQRLGTLLTHDRGTALSRLVHRAPPAIAAKLKAILKTLKIKGERAGSVAAYVALSSDPELAEWVHEAAEGLGLEPEVPEPAAVE